MGSPVETTLRALLLEYGLDDGAGILGSLAALDASLRHFEIACRPPIGSLGLDDARVLTSAKPSSLELALSVIDRGETSTVEFKSSLLFDWRRHLENPDLIVHQCKLDALVHSICKTLAAFLNTDGGTLLVGVDDSARIVGLAQDYQVTNPNRSDYDGWEQFLRGQIESRFVDGKSVNSYVRTEEIHCHELKFVRVQVASRRELSFLRKPPSTTELYIRSGTRSVAIDYENFEKHYDVTRKF